VKKPQTKERDMKKKIFIWLFLISFFPVFSSLLFSQTITITSPTSSSKWRGVQTIRWSVNNKTDEFRGINPPGNPGYYRIFYAPEGTSIPPFGEEPSSPWVKINGDIRDDGKETSSYSLDWDTAEVTSDGKYIILIRAYNPDGECVEDDSVTFLVDNTKPTVSVSFDPATPDGNHNWYKTAPKVTITVSDTDAGPRTTYPIRYSIGSGSYTWVNENPHTFTAVEGQILYAYGYDDAVDKNGDANESDQLVETAYKVDLTPPTIKINVDYGNRQFSLDPQDATSGIDWSSVQYEFVLQDDSTLGPYLYSQGSNVPIPDNVKTLRAYAMDIAGNQKTESVTFSTSRSISGYLKNYKGSPIGNITIQIAGDTNNTTTTNSSGYYQFTGLDDFGHYYVVPLVKNNIPAARIYDGLGEDKTYQNFVIVDGWLSKRYDRGGTNDYQFASPPILTPPVLAEAYSIGLTGTSLLTGVLNDDKKMDILFTDGNYLRGYYWTGTAYTRRIWSPKTTTYNISLLDSTQGETRIDSIILSGIGPDVAVVYDDKNGNMTKGITRESAPSGMKWSVISAGGGNFIFTGLDDNTGVDTILFYNTLTDTTLWETTLSQKIIPGTETICLREAGKAAVVIGSQSDTDFLVLTAIDIETGHSLWQRTFTGIRGKITPIVASIEEGGWDNIIAVRTSTDASSGEMVVYLLSGATGGIISQWAAPTSITPPTNTSFSAAVGDINNDGNKELVIADGSGNIYVVNLLTGSTITSALSKGKVWALVDFDGASGGNKEIVVSYGTTIRVLRADLTTLVSRDMGENINNVAISDTNGDNYPDIVVSLPSKTSILRAATTVDLPGTPVIADIYSSGGKVYIVWTYTPTASDLSGFRIYRSSNPSDDGSWRQAGTVAADVRQYTDSPSEGIYSYKVAAYNDYGEKRSSASDPVEVTSGGESSSGPASCFIATAAFGTPMAKEVVRLREFRDRYLLTNRPGRAFVRWYYRHSPRLAGYIRQRSWARAFVRGVLRPVVWFVSVIMR